MTTLYGGTQDYGLPTTLTGWSEYQAPMAPVYYNPVQQNYASQTNNNTTVKQQAPLIVPDFRLPDLPTAPNYQMGGIPQGGGNAQMFDNPAVTPVSQLLGNAAGPEGAYAVAPGGPTPSPSSATSAGAASIAAGGQDLTPPSPPSPDTPVNPAQFAPSLSADLRDNYSAPFRGRGQAPAQGADYSLTPPTGAPELGEIYKDVANQMAQVPVEGLTRAQKLGMLISPEARKMGLAKLESERKGRAAMAQKLIDERIDILKANMTKQLSQQQEMEEIRKFVHADPEEREAMERRMPQLANYRDIPASKATEWQARAGIAKAQAEIAKSAMEIYTAMYHKQNIQDEADQRKFDLIKKGLDTREAIDTYDDKVASSHAGAAKAQSDARVAQATEQDKIAQSNIATQIQQWDLANQPTKFFANNVEATAKYNDVIQKIQDGQIKAAEAPLAMAKTLSEISMVVDDPRIKDAALAALNLGKPADLPAGVHQNAKGQWVDAKNKPTAPPAPLGAQTLGGAALTGAVNAQSNMQVPQSPQSPMLIQGGVSDSTVQQFKPGQNQLQLIPPPPPMAPSIINNPNGLPMAGLPQGGIGGGVAGHQAPGGGFIPPPPPGMVPPQLLQQYPQLGGAVPASMGAPQQPLQGGVQITGQNPVQAFNQVMQPPPQPPQQQAAPPPVAQPPAPGPIEQLGNYLQSGKGHPPMLSKENPPQGLQRFLLGGALLGKAAVHGIGSGLAGVAGAALDPYRMPRPEQIKEQYEAQAVKRADKIESLVVTPWVTPESRGYKQGAMLTDPELYSYFAHKGRDTFTMRELIRRAGWTLPPEGFNGGNPGASQPMTHDYERFKRFDTGGPPPLPKPGDDAPYTQFNPKLLPRRK